MRVGQDEAAGAGTAVRLYAAKGETESFQIIVRGPSGGLTNVNVVVSDLQDAAGNIIPHTALTLYREHYVYVSQSSPDWRGGNRPLGPGWYADALIPFVDPATGNDLSGAALDGAPFAVAANKNQPVWVDVAVPTGTPAGEYTGTYTVRSAQGTAGGSITLTVWNFALPKIPSMHSSFLFWQAGTTKGVEELLRHRVFPSTAPRAEERRLIDAFGLGAVNLGFWSGADIGNCSMSASPSATQFRSAVESHQSDLSMYNYSADEVGSCPNLYPTIKEWARNMHQAGVRNLITMPPTADLFDDGAGGSAVDTWVILPVQYNAPMANSAIERGNSVWSYNTLVQDAYSPKWLIDFDPVNFRIQPGFLNQSLGLTGTLYWRIDRWSGDPWNQVNNTGTFSSSNYPGEGMLVYPGQQVGVEGVVASMRLKWMRDASDDFEYIELLKKAGREDWAMPLVRTVATDFQHWTRDKALLESIRIQLGGELDRLAAPKAPAAPSLLAPANGATNLPAVVTLTWSPSPGATSYEVAIGTSSTPSVVATVTSTSYTPAALAAGVQHHWRVTARNAAGTGSSAVWTFTTAAPLAAPVLRLPANGATLAGNAATLSWAASTGATNYDVHFGQQNPPPLVSSTTGLTYSVASLKAETTYYWRVVARNSVGSAASPTWSLQTPAAPVGPTAPVPVSATPPSGAGMTTSFVLTYSDANGFADLASVGILINSTASGTRACWLTYFPATKKLWMANDTASTWANNSIGSSTTLQNSQCSVALSGVTVSTNGNMLVLHVPFSFKPAFAGVRNLYLQASDKSGLGSGFRLMGSWTVR